MRQGSTIRCKYEEYSYDSATNTYRIPVIAFKDDGTDWLTDYYPVTINANATYYLAEVAGGNGFTYYILFEETADTDTPITGSAYGDGVEVVLKKLPANATSFSVTVPKGTFIRTGNDTSAENSRYYASKTFLDSTAWYNSLDAVMETEVKDNLCDSVEQLLQKKHCSTSEEYLKSLDYASPAEYWNDYLWLDSYDAEPFTLEVSKLAAMESDFLIVYLPTPV